MIALPTLILLLACSNLSQDYGMLSPNAEYAAKRGIQTLNFGAAVNTRLAPITQQSASRRAADIWARLRVAGGGQSPHLSAAVAKMHNTGNGRAVADIWSKKADAEFRDALSTSPNAPLHFQFAHHLYSTNRIIQALNQIEAGSSLAQEIPPDIKDLGWKISRTVAAEKLLVFAQALLQGRDIDAAIESGLSSVGFLEAGDKPDSVQEFAHQFGKYRRVLHSPEEKGIRGLVIDCLDNCFVGKSGGSNEDWAQCPPLSRDDFRNRLQKYFASPSHCRQILEPGLKYWVPKNILEKYPTQTKSIVDSLVVILSDTMRQSNRPAEYLPNAYESLKSVLSSEDYLLPIIKEIKIEVDGFPTATLGENFLLWLLDTTEIEQEKRDLLKERRMYASAFALFQDYLGKALKALEEGLLVTPSLARLQGITLEQSQLQCQVMKGILKETQRFLSVIPLGGLLRPNDASTATFGGKKLKNLAIMGAIHKFFFAKGTVEDPHGTTELFKAFLLVALDSQSRNISDSSDAQKAGISTRPYWKFIGERLTRRKMKYCDSYIAAMVATSLLRNAQFYSEDTGLIEDCIHLAKRGWGNRKNSSKNKVFQGTMMATLPGFDYGFFNTQLQTLSHLLYRSELIQSLRSADAPKSLRLIKHKSPEFSKYFSRSLQATMMRCTALDAEEPISPTLLAECALIGSKEQDSYNYIPVVALARVGHYIQISDHNRTLNTGNPEDVTVLHQYMARTCEQLIRLEKAFPGAHYPKSMESFESKNLKEAYEFYRMKTLGR